MNQIVALRGQEIYTGNQLELIKRTVAKDCNDSEFDLFVTVAKRAGLDPFRKQIMALVFSKTDPKKRRMSIVTGIDGLRAIADRSGTYSPDDEEPDFIYDPEVKGRNNPLGLVRAKVKIYKAGKAVVGIAYWDEFAPLKEIWKENPQTGQREPCGEFELDYSGQWPKMGRTMLAKCAESQALRKAYPEDLSGLYEHSELDRASASDLLPSEALGVHATEGRLQRIGASNGILFQLFPNAPLEIIGLGQIADRVIEALDSFTTYDQIRWFTSANQQPMREFWARSPTDALELKKRIEAATTKLQATAG